MSCSIVEQREVSRYYRIIRSPTTIDRRNASKHCQFLLALLSGTATTNHTTASLVTRDSRYLTSVDALQGPISTKGKVQLRDSDIFTSLSALWQNRRGRRCTARPSFYICIFSPIYCYCIRG